MKNNTISIISNLMRNYYITLNDFVHDFDKIFEFLTQIDKNHKHNNISVIYNNFSDLMSQHFINIRPLLRFHITN